MESVMKDLFKIVVFVALSLNFLYAKATILVDGYTKKLLFMNLKDGGTIYVDNEKRGVTSLKESVSILAENGKHEIKVCFPDGKSTTHKICGEQNVTLSDNEQINIKIKADKLTEMSPLEKNEAKCQYGDLGACIVLGMNYYSDKNAQKDYKKADELYQKACDGGNMRGCVDVGFAYMYGKGVEKDTKKAIDLFKKACEKGEMSGCAVLADAFEHGKGIKKDPLEAMRLYENACNGGNMAGCVKLGIAYKYGTCGIKSVSEATKLFEKVCDSGYEWGCYYLNQLKSQRYY